MFWLTLTSPFLPCNYHRHVCDGNGGGLPYLEVQALQFFLESDAPLAAWESFAMETCCAVCVKPIRG